VTGGGEVSAAVRRMVEVIVGVGVYCRDTAVLDRIHEITRPAKRSVQKCWSCVQFLVG
jgi:hypothetical protein